MIIFPKSIGEHNKNPGVAGVEKEEKRGAAMQGGRQEAAKALESCGPALTFAVCIFGRKWDEVFSTRA